MNASTGVTRSAAPRLSLSRSRRQCKVASPKLVTISGIVVHENNAAHSFVVAERSGRHDAIRGRLAVGEKVQVRVSKLANGICCQGGARGDKAGSA
jgi:hypothetical protein